MAGRLSFEGGGRRAEGESGKRREKERKKKKKRVRWEIYKFRGALSESGGATRTPLNIKN